MKMDIDVLFLRAQKDFEEEIPAILRRDQAVGKQDNQVKKETNNSTGSGFSQGMIHVVTAVQKMVFCWCTMS